MRVEVKIDEIAINIF